MSHDSVLAALNALSKTRVYRYSPTDHATHLVSESDRAAIILTASAAEHIITHMLEGRLAGFNSDERDRIFGPQGALGTFSDKIQIAQGLSIFNRSLAKKLHVVRAMRNAAAHHVGPLSFETPEVRDAVLQLISSKNREEASTWPAYGMRALFCYLLALIEQVIGGLVAEHDEENAMSVIRELAGKPPQSSLETPAE